MEGLPRAVSHSEAVLSLPRQAHYGVHGHVLLEGAFQPGGRELAGGGWGNQQRRTTDGSTVGLAPDGRSLKPVCAADHRPSPSAVAQLFCASVSPSNRSGK